MDINSIETYQIPEGIDGINVDDSQQYNKNDFILSESDKVKIQA